jgi:hypothetical protein
VTRPPFEVASIDELERFPVGEHGLVWRPVRRRFDVRAFGVNAWSADRAGDEVVEHHTEASLRHEELYAVVRGRARFEVGDDELDAPAGTLVYLRDPEVRRGATAVEPGTVVLAVGGRAGEPFSPSPWERWYVAYGRADAGDVEAGIAELEGALADHPEHGGLHYHLACLESRAGRLDDALAHLLRAVELDPRTREWASDDADLDAIRGRAGFPA